MPAERVHYTARRDTRHALRETFHEISGYQLNTSGEFSAATLEGNLHLSPATTDLYHWLRAIVNRLMDDIDFGPRPSVNSQNAHLAPGVDQAPQQSAVHHGVFLPPPPVLNTPQGLPPILPGIASPVTPQASYGIPRIQTYEIWSASQHQPGQRSLAKEDRRLGSSMTARKAAIYGTTPEEWMARSVHRF
ncbi:hypothetical protein JCM10296v2_005109 [Rhodotorula toruloides]